jgi:hypothetical protein
MEGIIMSMTNYLFTSESVTEGKGEFQKIISFFEPNRSLPNNSLQPTARSGG